WEKNDHIGGALKLATVPPGKEKLGWLIEYYDYMVKKLNIRVQLNKSATEAAIESFNPDVVVMAYGVDCFIPSIKGIDRPNCITFKKVLNKEIIISGKTVIIGGGGLVGCETALFLAEQGNNVTIIRRHPGRLATGMESISRNYLLTELEEKNVKHFVNMPIKEIKENEIAFENGISMSADFFVIAFGGRPDHTLYNRIRMRYETYLIGDAVRTGKIIDAVQSGFAIGKLR
ncbi:MAG: FAD-dependent oxidoreductase, partial [Nitrospiraceae bacterium]|nr:FAD-dependent oxidoreductase [Nitrospiraceae bacterium]